MYIHILVLLHWNRRSVITKSFYAQRSLCSTRHRWSVCRYTVSTGQQSQHLPLAPSPKSLLQYSTHLPSQPLCALHALCVCTPCHHKQCVYLHKFPSAVCSVRNTDYSRGVQCMTCCIRECKLTSVCVHAAPVAHAHTHTAE